MPAWRRSFRTERSGRSRPRRLSYPGSTTGVALVQHRPSPPGTGRASDRAPRSAPACRPPRRSPPQRAPHPVAVTPRPATRPRPRTPARRAAPSGSARPHAGTPAARRARSTPTARSRPAPGSPPGRPVAGNGAYCALGGIVVQLQEPVLQIRTQPLERIADGRRQRRLGREAGQLGVQPVFHVSELASSMAWSLTPGSRPRWRRSPPAIRNRASTNCCHGPIAPRQTDIQVGRSHRLLMVRLAPSEIDTAILALLRPCG